VGTSSGANVFALSIWTTGEIASRPFCPDRAERYSALHFSDRAQYQKQLDVHLPDGTWSVLTRRASSTQARSPTCAQGNSRSSPTASPQLATTGDEAASEPTWHGEVLTSSAASPASLPTSRHRRQPSAALKIHAAAPRSSPAWPSTRPTPQETSSSSSRLRPTSRARRERPRKFGVNVVVAVTASPPTRQGIEVVRQAPSRPAPGRPTRAKVWAGRAAPGRDSPRPSSPPARSVQLPLPLPTNGR